jgi:hypothetical protein
MTGQQTKQAMHGRKGQGGSETRQKQTNENSHVSAQLGDPEAKNVAL